MTATRTRPIAAVVAEQRPRPVVRVIAYLRISEDPNELHAGTDRQEAALRNLCAYLSAETDEDFVIVRVERDEDESNSLARDKRAPRAAYTRIVDEMAAGTTGADAIAFWDQDRWVKDPEEWGRWVKLTMLGRGLRVLISDHFNGGHEEQVGTSEWFTLSTMRMYSSNTDTLRQMKRIKGAVAKARASGKMGGRVAYGWARVPIVNEQSIRVDWYDVEHPQEAALLRYAAARVLEGWSLTRICHDLNNANREGEPGPGPLPVASVGRKNEASRWEITTLKRLLCRPANIGMRIDSNGMEEKIANPPLLDEATYRDVVVTLTAPNRQTHNGTSTRHLLSHIMRCGRCNAKMVRTRVYNKKKDYLWIGYRCNRYYHVTIDQDSVDKLVTRTVLNVLKQSDAAGWIDDGGEAKRAADKLQVLERELQSYRFDHEEREVDDVLRIDKAEWDRQRTRYKPLIANARRAAHSGADSPGVRLAIDLSLAADIDAAWGKLALGQKRLVLSTLFDITTGAKPLDTPKNVPDLSRVSVRLKKEYQRGGALSIE